jgi:hypothetical protein
MKNEFDLIFTPEQPHRFFKQGHTLYGKDFQPTI